MAFKQDLEHSKIKQRQERLELDSDGKLSGESLLWEGDPDWHSGHSSFGRAPDSFDVVGNLRLWPKYNEKDPETFFLFELVADAPIYTTDYTPIYTTDYTPIYTTDYTPTYTTDYTHTYTTDYTHTYNTDYTHRSILEYR